MRTFENFRKVINESDYILSEAQRYLEILLEKDSEALKQYKKSQKSFQKGFGKNIKPTVVQPGLDLYKAGGPFVPDKTTFKDTGKKVPKMEPKPQFGKPKNKNKAPDRTGLKQTITNIRASDKRLYDAGVGKKPSLVQQRKYTKERIKQLSRQTTLKDRMYGSTGSTEGMGGASGSSSKTVTPTKVVKQSEVSKDQRKFGKEINQARIEKTSKSSTKSKSDVNRIAQNKIDTQKADQFKKTDAYKNVAQGKDSQGNYLTPQQRKKNFKNFQSDLQKVNKKITVGAAPDYVAKSDTGVTPPPVKKVSTGITKSGNISYATDPTKLGGMKVDKATQAIIKRETNKTLKLPQNVKYAVAASKRKGIARGFTRFLGKLGPKGRLAAAGATAFFATPMGRNFAKNLAVGGGLTAALGLAGKKEKVLKKGDGLKTVGKVNVRYGLTGTSKKGQGGKVYDPKQMAQLGKVQKNFIDKYNQKASRNPFKKQIQYKPKADGTYKILDPKKK